MIKTEPKNTTHWLILGRVYLELKNPTLALATLQEILVLKPDNLIALIHSYDVLIALRKIC